MKNEKYVWEVSCDPDWGMRCERDRIFYLYLKTSVSMKTLQRRLQELSNNNQPTAIKMLLTAQRFHKFSDCMSVRRLEVF